MKRSRWVKGVDTAWRCDAHMMINYSTGAHVRMLHLISHQHTPPVSAIQTGQSHHRGMWSTREVGIANYHPSLSPLSFTHTHSYAHTHTLTPVIFSALMLCCLCHRPFCAPTSPPTHLSLHHSARSGVGQFISLLSWHFHLALCPSHTTFLHFRHLADVVIRSKRAGKWTSR